MIFGYIWLRNGDAQNCSKKKGDPLQYSWLGKSPAICPSPRAESVQSHRSSGNVGMDVHPSLIHPTLLMIGMDENILKLLVFRKFWSKMIHPNIINNQQETLALEVVDQCWPTPQQAQEANHPWGNCSLLCKRQGVSQVSSRNFRHVPPRKLPILAKPDKIWYGLVRYVPNLRTPWKKWVVNSTIQWYLQKDHLF